jgi:hypothetical protein
MKRTAPIVPGNAATAPFISKPFPPAIRTGFFCAPIPFHPGTNKP